MTEDAFTTPETEPVDRAPDEAVESTGHPQVDAVLASLAGLDDTPVEEHVAVFESAHDTLRGALANAGDAPPPQA
ncbi:hypothetical protein [Nocardioides iriomotensis]|uniref:Uncharacterized protein n=1 Tax=Nocardioides iriomotensis TaxID=715784 RepID=A0A4Q5J5X2_9ACTN|nr:hypothetical protein [Nocardioides iriomotensis]RYU13031.1 hypothetical protein ETU37_08865 [Nocardioides iriomotensis]